MSTNNPFHRAIYLTGPTASGKTRVALALAERLNAEILALDSMTVYRGLDIGTAKPTLEEQSAVAHHLIDILDPWEATSVAAYRARAESLIMEIEQRRKRPLFVGGTALYLKTLLRGLFEGPAAVPELRQELEAEADRHGDDRLHARLSRLDPATGARLHPNDRRRVIRALEVITTTGEPLSRLQQEHDRPAPRSVAVLALQRPREELHERIHQRVDQMFADGLVAEVRGLLEAPHGLHPVPAGSVGYREVIDHLEGRASLDQTIAQVKTRTRQFAKRQETWFRGLSEVEPWPILPSASPELLASQLAEHIQDIERRPS